MLLCNRKDIMFIDSNLYIYQSLDWGGGIGVMQIKPIAESASPLVYCGFICIASFQIKTRKANSYQKNVGSKGSNQKCGHV